MGVWVGTGGFEAWQGMGDKWVREKPLSLTRHFILTLACVFDVVVLWKFPPLRISFQPNFDDEARKRLVTQLYYLFYSHNAILHFAVDWMCESWVKSFLNLSNCIHLTLKQTWRTSGTSSNSCVFVRERLVLFVWWIPYVSSYSKWILNERVDWLGTACCYSNLFELLMRWCYRPRKHWNAASAIHVCM